MIRNIFCGYAIIIQARLNSSRLKNKILKKVYKNLTLLDFLIIRLLKVYKSSKIIFALAKNPNNFKIINILNKFNIKYFEGSENNVLKRYFDCAKTFKVKNIIRVTSDCPLIDPYLVKKMYKNFQKNKIEYLANTLPEKNKKYPDGSDIEIFTFNALSKIYKLKLNKHDKEHVTNKFWNSRKFKKKLFFSRLDFSQYRFSVDYQSDITIVKSIICKLKKLNQFGFTQEIVSIIEKNKEIKKIMNQNMIKQKLRRKNIFK